MRGRVLARVLRIELPQEYQIMADLYQDSQTTVAPYLDAPTCQIPLIPKVQINIRKTGPEMPRLLNNNRVKLLRNRRYSLIGNRGSNPKTSKTKIPSC